MPNAPKTEAPTPDPVPALPQATESDIHEAVATIHEACEIIRDALQLSLRPAAGLAGIRTVTVAPGINNIQALLDDGWELISGTFCDEIRETGGLSGRATETQWVPYAFLGKRDPVASFDRQGLAADAERKLAEHASPLTSSAAEAAPTSAPAVEPMGHAVQQHRTQPVGSGYEATGGLAGRR